MFEKFMFKKIEMWLVGLLVIVMLGLAYVVGVAVHHKMAGGQRLGSAGDALIAFVSMPHQIMMELRGQSPAHPLAALEMRFEGQQGFAFAPKQPGEGMRPYWLLTRYDGDLGRGVVDFVDLEKQETVHRWVMRGEDYFAELMPLMAFNGNGAYPVTDDNFRPVHPWLLEDGSIVLQHHSTPLLRLDLCGERQWIDSSYIYHHGIEGDADGNIWVSTYMQQTVDGLIDAALLDDALIKVSPDGEVLFVKSVVEILESAGLEGLLYGTGNDGDHDPIHLNDIQPALADGPHWQKGDVFISLRNLSMILLYRPSIDQLVWHKIGPWLSQHDVDILDDHRIAIFSNETVRSGQSYQVRNKANRVIIYDFATDQVSGPFDQALRDLEVRTAQEGLSDILPDGSVIVEETEMGRALHIGPDGGVRWSYVNRAQDGKTYQLGWSRPISRDLGDQVMAKLAATTCPVH